jgi:hypothetical protein
MWRLSAIAVAVWLAVYMVCGCGALTHVRVPVGSADAVTPSTEVQLAVDPDRPVLLRAVDGQALAWIQISNRLRAITYVLPPGEHELWLSAAPYGLPFLPQRLRCYVLRASFAAGGIYKLALDPDRQAPLLVGIDPELQVVGELVDEPLVLERGCKWR